MRHAASAVDTRGWCIFLTRALVYLRLGLLPMCSNQRGSSQALGLHCALAAYEAAMATVRRQLAPFSAAALSAVRPDASPALHEAAWDELRLHPRRRLDLAGRDSHIRLDTASEKLLCSVESRQKRPIMKAQSACVRRPINLVKFTGFDTENASPLCVSSQDSVLDPFESGLVSHFSTAAMRLLGRLASIRTEGEPQVWPWLPSGPISSSGCPRLSKEKSPGGARRALVFLMSLGH
ncbi:hypothetical protein TARUN_4312 [Trichoderma arundinaceum]|uniref:Uncharacterized protein n=1 Tax=Trichoderma arundinaceum TaxID=490622 RepID=A0A395NPR4_TRIAR|nr:hypothetical protein TARUN_4312 [Trichoderma arundinaceum]